MKDTTHWRVEIDQLRAELIKVWFERPFPADKIALLNRQLKAAVDQSGFTIEGKAKTSRYGRKRYYAMHPNAVPREHPGESKGSPITDNNSPSISYRGEPYNAR